MIDVVVELTIGDVCHVISATGADGCVPFDGQSMDDAVQGCATECLEELLHAIYGDGVLRVIV